MNITLFNIQHFSLDDGPGIRTVVFFKGCPLHCAWCHNPESQKIAPELAYSREKCVMCGKCAAACQQGVHSFGEAGHGIDRRRCIACGKCVRECDYAALELFGRNFTVDEVMTEIAKDDVFFADGGGVTFSGGEPFRQFEALHALASACRGKGYSVCIETSGYTDGEKLKMIAPYVDTFLYDCKETDDENHRKYTGVSNARILQNLSLLDECGAEVILRCPVIPSVNDRDDHFRKIGELANAHACIKRIELMRYHPLGIAKAEKIGEAVRYDNERFLDKTTAEGYAAVIRGITDKTVGVN